VLRRLIIAASVLLFLVLVLAALWNVLDWPPPRLILKYGFPPTGGPTGRTMTIEGVEFVELKPGYFRMGSHYYCEEGDLLGRICTTLHFPWGRKPSHDSQECPPHWVEIRRPFWIARTEITEEQYRRFDPTRQYANNAKRRPMAEVSWEQARAYCEWLDVRGSLHVTLPSEAEWEYSCGAGSTKEFSHGDDEGRAGMYILYWDRSAPHEKRVVSHFPKEVGLLKPNAWGLCDLSGSLWEWCADSWHRNYESAPETESPWLEGGEDFRGVTIRPVRGGDWGNPLRDCRCASRRDEHPYSATAGIGLRPLGVTR
jgi:formylglycine-generating enzyme required for sulfatase activity